MFDLLCFWYRPVGLGGLEQRVGKSTIIVKWHPSPPNPSPCSGISLHLLSLLEVGGDADWREGWALAEAWLEGMTGSLKSNLSLDKKNLVQWESATGPEGRRGAVGRSTDQWLIPTPMWRTLKESSLGPGNCFVPLPAPECYTEERIFSFWHHKDCKAVHH